MPTRNDPAQYEQLADAWWDPRGPFAMLHWLAAARASLIPPAANPGAILVDLGCGGGLLAPHIAGLGYHHVGIDASPAAVAAATAHGVDAVRGDARRVPLAAGCAAVVTAGELLEHVADPGEVIDEAARLLRPAGTLVIDTIAAGPLARLVAVTVAERLPGGPPRGLHDPALFVDLPALVRRCAAHGIALRIHGIRPSLPQYISWSRGRRASVAMIGSRLPAVLVAGTGTRRA